MRASLAAGRIRGRRLLVLGSAVAAAIAAAVAAMRRRRRIEHGDASASLTGVPALALAPGDEPAPPAAPTGASTPQAATSPSATSSAAATTPSPTPPVAATAPSARTPGQQSRADLYRRARAAGITGRSKMTKEQLERALSEHPG